MNVRLISHSIPDKINDLDDCQDLVAYCARVSNPGNQNNKETSEKLIKYLIKHQKIRCYRGFQFCHFSPRK